MSQKNQQQIEQTLKTSAVAINQTVGAESGSSNGQTNLNNSTTSAHLNVYKPTFIINNSYQPGQTQGDVHANEAIKTESTEGNLHSEPTGGSYKHQRHEHPERQGTSSSSHANVQSSTQSQQKQLAANKSM